jgi:polysaccharide deacetylase family protein (PEP-CTERM system associated)
LNVIQNAFSVDVEEYFQVHNFEAEVSRDRWSEYESRLAPAIDCLLALLARHSVQGTFFVLSWHAERLRPIVRGIRAAGHEIASHGCLHRLVYQQSPAEFRQDVRRSKAILEDMIGEAVVGYRAPCYSITSESLWAFEVLRDEGYLYDSSIYPMRRRRYGIPDAPRFPHRRPEGIVEFPLTTWRCMGVNVPAASGGYLRLLPLAVSARSISQLNAAGHPAVINVHPWELDPEQPRLSGGYLGGVTHYVNLRRTEPRLAALLRRASFGPMHQILAQTGLLSPPTADARPSHG